MSPIKIGIVEDEMIIADNLCRLLEHIGYEVTEPATSYMEAIEMLNTEKPDLVLLDIQIKGSRDGIDLAWKIKEDYNMPFIFLTANADPATIERAKKTEPPSFLVKPFNRDDLYTAIEICFYNFEVQKNVQKKSEPYVLHDALFVKEGNYFHKVKFDEVLYLESENVYVVLHTPAKKILVRASMQSYLENFDPKKFVKVHRGYVINIQHLETINAESVVVNGHSLPLSKSYRDDLMAMLRIG